MTLPAFAATLDDIAEGLRDEYEQGEDGRYYLKIEDIDAHPMVAGLKTNHDSLLAEKKRLADQLLNVPADLDKLLADLARLRKKDADAALKEAEATGDQEAIRRQLQEQHEAAKAEWEKERNGYENEFDAVLRRDKALQEIAKIPQASVRLLLPQVLPLTKMIRENGVRKVIVINEAGERRIGKAGNDMTIQELLAELRQDPELGGAFPPDETTGGGATGRRAAGGGNGISSRADLKTVEEKTAYIDKHGPDAFAKLPRGG